MSGVAIVLFPLPPQGDRRLTAVGEASKREEVLTRMEARRRVYLFIFHYFFFQDMVFNVFFFRKSEVLLKRVSKTNEKS